MQIRYVMRHRECVVQNIANGVPHSIKLKFSLNFLFDFFRAADFNLMSNVLVQKIIIHKPSKGLYILVAYSLLMHPVVRKRFESESNCNQKWVHS